MKAKNLLSLYLFYWVMTFYFLLITLNACGGVTGRRGADVNQSQQSTATLGKWTWVSGDNAINQRGVYGSKGVAASTNKPGARYGSISWTDSTGNLWLFGGYGYGGTGFLGCLNDLWKYDGTNWTWVSGDNAINQRGVFGTKGIAAGTNKPSARYGSISWTDSTGNLWLFGGYGYAGTGFLGSLSDLWKFDGANWTWVSGDFRQNEPGVYGTKGVAASTNKPGARYGSISWTDSTGNLWLFGGNGYDRYGSRGYLNDLWKFDGANWTWVSGDSTPNEAGIYGTKGVAVGTNKPGGRYGGISWTDSTDNLWLFGGYGTGFLGGLNDLWKFDGTNWTWVSGENIRLYKHGVYGTKGVAASTNKPGGRYRCMSWTDSTDNLWLFGGGRKWSRDYFSDLWKFEP